jgi:HYR domain/Dockerin type I domain
VPRGYVSGVLLSPNYLIISIVLVMEILFMSVLDHSRHFVFRIMISTLILVGLAPNLSAAPDDRLQQENGVMLTAWNFYLDASEGDFAFAAMPGTDAALACIPYVNISLGQEGLAVITALTLVAGPQYPAFQYEVDIMGDLTNTVYCEQLGQELMVVVFEIPTGNSCMSTIYVEDKLRPTLVCTSDTIPCNVDIETIDFENYIESVTDNCDDDPTIWYSYVVQNLPCNIHGFTQQILVNWTATDDSGNSATCQDVIYLKKPAINLIVFPPDISISCTNPNIDPSVTGEPTYNGEPVDHSCQYVVYKTDQVIPMCNGAQKILRLWTVMDWCTSAKVTDVQEILIVDNTPPNITCPPNITLNTAFAVCTVKYTLPTPVVSDACADPDEIDIDITLSGIPGIYSPGQMVNLGLGVTLITMKATDPCGNTRICQYSVTVRDNTPPTIICPGNVTVSCNESTLPANTGSATAFDYCDATPTITYSDVTTASQSCLGYNIMRTWKATDDSGNMSICMQIIVFTDEVPPVITCPANITVSCTASTAPANTGSATATDVCDATPTITFSDVTTGGSCPQERTISRTWSATDDCGNTSTCVQTIFVDDNLAPVITCPPDVSIECADSTNPAQTGSATATDNCDATVTITYTDVTAPSGPQEFTITRTWKATDDCGNSSTCIQHIIVHDETPPVIDCPDNITVSCTASTLPPGTGTATATDNCDPDPAITYSDVTVGGACPQELTITRTWIAEDDCGNTSTCTQTIFVDDSSAPNITCPANITIQCTAVTLPANTGTATATDNCDVTPSITFTDVTVGGACPQERTINRTWIATDDCGNSSTCLQVISVDDSVAPAITCPPNVTIQCTASTMPGNTGSATATDNCDATPAITFSDVIIPGGCPQERTINRTWSATDDCGNISTCLQTINVEDSVAPSITCPANITIECTSSTLPPTTGTATATDNCAATPGITFSDVIIGGVCPLLEMITRTWIASDGCGNSSTCVQIIVVTDSGAPSITCPANVTIECSASTLPVNTGTPVATDNCDTSPSLTFSDVTAGGGCPQEYTITRTWIATDDCGNSATCAQTIFIDDSLAPSITCPSNVTIECNENTLPANTGSATATDNCDATPAVTFSDVTSGSGCPEGYIITRTWIATDDCGNAATCNQVITVDDNTAPIVSCPINVTIECSDNTAPVNTGTATASDACDASPTITFSDVTVGGACPQVYTITRTWIATDDCGNSGTCNQVISLEDTTAPNCQAADITVSLLGSGFVTILASQVDDGSTDNCGAVELAVAPSTFDCNTLGDNMVVLTVTDCSGNSSTCTAIVTVVDDGGLEAICQNLTIILDANGNASVDPEDVDNGSGGGCGTGMLEFDLSQTDFTCVNVGNVIVVLTVTDENGNTATCTAIITVVDNMVPEITCPANLTVDCHEVTDPNNTGQFGNATATDNCPGTVITETHVIDINECGVGTIVRTFVATDASGNSASCTQLVTISNPNPLGEDDITWPASPISVNICNSTDPDDIPNGEPVIDPSALLCADPVITFSDQVVMNVDNNPNTPCKIITRTWTITDNCQPNGTFVFVQTINVQDMVPPVFTNINDMTKVANANCVAFFTLIASATDCAGVSITNNSPYGATTGANASGNYPIGVTIVIFTATDGCGNISTMDVVITVTDPDPTEFQCEKIIVILPEETEITIAAEDFITFFEGNCTTEDDFIISYSRTNPFDTLETYDCGDVGVSTFNLYFWNADGSMLLDSCTNADLDLRDPEDFCMDGLLLWGNVESEDGHAVSGVEVSITNAPMVPDTTDYDGQYMLEGLNEGVGYQVTPFNDLHHREGVSTLDLVLIQKHLLGKAKLNSPYKMIAADANKSGHLTALDLLEIRKLILGINTRFPNNTSWRFIDREHEFSDPYNPFNPGFPESVWVDSVVGGIDTVNFVGVKVGDVNGSYFLSKAAGGKIEPRSGSAYSIYLQPSTDQIEGKNRWEVSPLPDQGAVSGLQFSLFVGELSADQVKEMCSDVLTSDQWYYDAKSGVINVSWSSDSELDLTGKTILGCAGGELSIVQMHLISHTIHAEVYQAEDSEWIIRDIQLAKEGLEEEVEQEYHLFQNIPNPFNDGTVIRFSVPREETVKLVIHDLAGRQIFTREAFCHPGLNEIAVKGTELNVPGIYYYTLYTLNASFTRKMSFTNN